MSIELISREEPHAKKQHRCTWCGQAIAIGTLYVREFIMVEGDPGTNKLHPECDKALAEAATAEGGAIYFDPYSNPRGAIDADNIMSAP